LGGKVGTLRQESLLVKDECYSKKKKEKPSSLSHGFRENIQQVAQKLHEQETPTSLIKRAYS